MPFYDLHCADCGKDSNIWASMEEKTEKKVVCPECGSNQLETIYSPVNFHIKDKTPPACPNSHICGSGCQHAHGA